MAINLKRKSPILKTHFALYHHRMWEDPGFVLIESAINRTFILSSDCPNGPKEFLEDNKKVEFV